MTGGSVPNVEAPGGILTGVEIGRDNGTNEWDGKQ